MGHRVAPDRLVDLLALEHLALGLREQLQHLELAPGQVHAACGGRTPGTGPRGSRARRRRAARCPRGPRRACGGARRPRTRASTSSGWHGLVTQSSAPSRSPRTRCATRRAAGADHHAEPGQRGGRRARGTPTRPGRAARGRPPARSRASQRTPRCGAAPRDAGTASRDRSARFTSTRTNPESESRIASRMGPTSRRHQCTHTADADPPAFTAFSQATTAQVTDFPHVLATSWPHGGSAAERPPLQAGGARGPARRVPRARRRRARWT